MQVSVKATRFEMTPDVDQYLNEKLSAIEKLIPPTEADDEVRCDVELEKTTEQQHGMIWRAEINMTIQGELYRADAYGEDINTAIDEVRDEVMKRIRRNKKKRSSIMRRSGAKLKEWARFGRRSS